MKQALLGMLLIGLLAGCQPAGPEPSPSETPLSAVTRVPSQGETLELKGVIPEVHDPVIAHANDVYYIFHTGTRIPIVCSQDMITWKFCGRVFESYPAWTREVNPNLADAWAPDISFFNGRWHLYYSVSSFGTQDSAIGLATNSTLDPASPDYAWVDQGVVLRSRRGDRWNAIDPNLVLDENGAPWLAWGSFWQGIWMRKVDATTGMLDAGQPDVVHLADRSTGPGNTTAIEAPFIAERNGKWYLFVSFDRCCQGTASTYNLRVGRSDTLTGPYVDRDGIPLTQGGGTLILSAYDRWRGPGHNGMLIKDGVYWMVYHAYDAQAAGKPKLRIESLSWDTEGWPSLPSQARLNDP